MAEDKRANTDVVAGTYGKYLIRLERSTHRFYIELPDEERLSADTYEKVKLMLDAREKVERKASRRKLDLKLIDGSDGTLRVATGIHLSTRRLNLTPRPDDHYSTTFYVSLPWVRLLVARKNALQEHMDAITRALKPAQVDHDAPGYGRIESEEHMDNLITGVLDRYRKAVKAPAPGNLEDLLK